jgi:hypothetical protein
VPNTGDALKHRLADAAKRGAEAAVRKEVEPKYSVEVVKNDQLSLLLRVRGSSGLPRYFVFKVSEPI